MPCLQSLILILSAGLLHAAPDAHLWRPVADDVYLQEVGSQIRTSEPVRSIAVYNGVVYAGFDSGLKCLKEGQLVDASGPTGAIRRLESIQGTLYAAGAEGLHRYDGAQWTRLAEGSFSDACEHLGGVYAAGSDAICRVTESGIEPASKQSNQPILAITSYSGTLYAVHSRGVSLVDPSRENEFDAENVRDWGEPFWTQTRDLLAQGSRLYIATDRGLGVLRGMALTAMRGPQGLPCEDTVCLAPGFDGDLWIGTTWGAVRAVDGEYHYFAGERWLPNDRVNAIACGERSVYIATDGGIAVIDYEPYTLQKKAAYYERHLEEWGQKRLGFTHKLEWNSGLNEWVREVSDNDVGWSTHYLTAMCFKFAVTGDKHARDEAVDFFNSVKWSEEITGIPGFPARSVWAVGEKGHQAQHGSGGLPAEWHETPDGVWQWKGDTSSDETDAHFYAVPIFHDLVATGRDKDRAKEHLRRVAAHIYENGWVLRDVDGQPTRWARWDPEYLQGPKGYYARGLNGLEVLAYMQTASTLTGDPRFAKALDELYAMGYHQNVLRQKLTFSPGFIFHSDDRLAFYAYHPVLMYTTDPTMRSIYLRSFERSWEVERIEHIPWFNFIYGGLTGNDCEADEAVRHLREWPLDLIDYSYQHSQRADLHTPDGYVAYSGGTRPISPREKGPCRWVDNQLSLEGGSGGQAVVDPAGWLDAYWMGRYYGMIEAPTVKDKSLTTVKRDRGLHLGAESYQGPPRPALEP